jgi:hypothetical protein
MKKCGETKKNDNEKTMMNDERKMMMNNDGWKNNDE